MPDASRLEQALSRFDAAIDELATAMEHHGTAPGGAEGGDGTGGGEGDRHAALQAELEALREDRARLVDELKGLRERNSELADARTKAVGRIDDAMSRIRTVLGE